MLHATVTMKKPYQNSELVEGVEFELSLCGVGVHKIHSPILFHLNLP
jgi:hypothetical protein